MAKQEINFEKSFARLEEILQKMNSGSVPLDESLKLYEEADRLIVACASRLNEVEQRVEKLIKNRNGDLETDPMGNPLVEDFQPLEI